MSSSATGAPLAGEIDPRRRRRHRRWTHTPPIAFSSGGTTTDGSVWFSDSGDEQTFRSGGSHGECRSSEVEGVSITQSPAPTAAAAEVEEVDLESGELERKVHYYCGKRKKKRRKKREKEEERECRICHLNLMENEVNEEEIGDDFGCEIQLGCDCKGDLGAAHKKCAETWFKIRGNIICEICGAIALNVASDQMVEALNVSVEHTNLANYNDGPVAEVNTAPEVVSRARFFDGRRVMNTLLVLMIVAFIISWLFHFHVFR